MSSVAIQGNAAGAGVFTIASPNSASSYTATLPANTGTLLSNKTPGTVLQVVSTIKQDTFSMSGASFVAITGLTAAITPASTSNKVLVQISIGRASINSGSGLTMAFQIVRNSTVVGAGTPAGSQLATSFVASSANNSNYGSGGLAFQFLDSPSSTSSITYSVQVLGESSAGVYINRSYTGGTGSTTYESASASTITATEIAA